MDRFIHVVFLWSEVWPLVIPLAIALVCRPASRPSRVLVLYLVFALLINLSANLMTIYRAQLPPRFQSNNILYNLHSVVKVFLFTWYFRRLGLINPRWLPQLVLLLYGAFALVNFIFFESIWVLSSRLLSAESIVLLFLCILYFLNSMHDETERNWLKHPSFIVTAALSFYEAATFFIFLFYYPIVATNIQFGILTMKIYAVCFIIFSILTAVALHKDRRKTSAA
ncbi:MAG TPA: hypothetical protein VEB63_00825 [Chitinophagaceae bacterium]|nr:hypothetical protein [Chitinophagaceae bacterium]